ncbi:MAG: response regulator [Bacteroidota bacterium]
MIYNILIIEDETETSKYLALALQREGFYVECAENGEQGLEILKKGKIEFDLIVLDLKMPKMFGDEVLKEIRKISPYIQVVVYTNYGQDTQVLQKLINLGIDGFIKKGATADLKSTVDIIKSKLIPMDEDARKELLNKFFTQITLENQ